MFYSHQILNNSQYGVATIWVAANHGTRTTGLRKLSRKDIEQVNIPKSVEQIMEPGPPISLRMQSNLLCGTARIFQRKCHYVLGDVTKAKGDLITFMRTPAIEYITDPQAGKARRDQITLGDAPDFVPSGSIPQFTLDEGFVLFSPGFQASRSSGKDKSQSQLSPFPDDFFGGDNSRIHLDFDRSQSSSIGLEAASFFARKPGTNTFLPQTFDMVMDANPLIYSDDDDFGGLHMRVDENGALIDDDELELPPLLGLDPFEPEIQDQDHQRQEVEQVGQEQPAQEQTAQEHDPVINEDAVVLIPGNDLPVPLEEDAFKHPQSPEEVKQVGATAPAAKRRRAIVQTDNERTTLARSVVKSWQDNYVQTAEEQSRKRRKITRGQVRDNAYRLVFGRGISDVGERRGVPQPLATFFAGEGLIVSMRHLYPSDEEEQAAPVTPSRGRRRASAEAFGEEEDDRNVKPRLEEPPQQARSNDSVPNDLGFMLGNESLPEIGMEAAPPLPEHMSPSVMPWNQTPSVGRGSQSGQQARHQLSSRRGSSLPPFGQRHNGHSSDFGDFGDFSGLQEHNPADPEGLLDGVRQANENEAEWSLSTMDTASNTFLQWTEEEVKEKGQVKEGDTKENRRWVEFEDLVQPGQQNHVVAAQAFYHILSLATKNVISVEQDVENLRPYGTIRVGVDMTAHINAANREGAHLDAMN